MSFSNLMRNARERELKRLIDHGKRRVALDMADVKGVEARAHDALLVAIDPTEDESNAALERACESDA